MRKSRLISSSLAISAALASGHAAADPTLRLQVNQRGDFLVIGNSLGFECASDFTPPAPVVGTVTCPNAAMHLNDTAPDIFWRSDAPANGQAIANTTVAMADARSTAVLTLPAGATITYARIYWAGLLAAQNSSDGNVLIERPSIALSQTVTADSQYIVPRDMKSWYQSTADVTALVQDAGAGAFRIGNVETVNLIGRSDNDSIAAWAMVVFYQRPTDPPRNLALFDGLDWVPSNGSTSVDIDGFLVPNAGFDAKLGVISYEGEQQYVGDALLFNDTVVSNAQNPANNFFNSSHSYLGAASSSAGDLPQLTGTPGSMAGLDIDVVDVKSLVAAGDTAATIEARSGAGGDTFLLGAFITSISTFKPDFTTSGKTFEDVNGGDLLPGDEIRYTVTITNTGNDASAGTVMTDALPEGISYVPGSLAIGTGATAVGLTDAVGDDLGEYVAADRTVLVRVGTGATASAGGSVAIGESVVVSFLVTVDDDASGTIENQAVITASGEQGAPEDDFPTDGNGAGDGAPPTEITVDQDADDDGIGDDTEVSIGTDPDDADTDDDGVPDGDEPDFDDDSDGDGLINALDPDSDNDGLFDGTELGLGCTGAGTAAGSTSCVADQDPGTTTDPLDADTDDGGVADGAEDFDHDGELDSGETDPTAGHGSDDGTLDDTDGDGLSNGEEEALGSDPNDADSDDDGVPDGAEVNPSDDTDGDGLINVLDPDSDNDGLYDGTELGLGCDDDATDPTAQHCKADADGGATVTSPVNPDTDGGGVSDGNEDVNLDGAIDAGETDPTLGHGGDDVAPTDTDGDGLGDDLEETIGTDPNDADSDNDGVVDGDEPNFADDTDGDGNINALDSDSDEDGLFDGTELGKACDGPGTDASADQCVADADEGATTTNPLDPDTDDGGVLDGVEDTDHDGQVDEGERDPNDASDDDTTEPTGGNGGTAGTSGNGGAAGSAGTAGSSGAGGASGGVAGSGASAGEGGEATGGTSSGGTSGAGEGGEAGTTGIVVEDGVLEGGGCSCRVAGDERRTPWAGAWALAALVGLGLRRRIARRRGA